MNITGKRAGPPQLSCKLLAGPVNECDVFVYKPFIQSYLNCFPSFVRSLLSYFVLSRNPHESQAEKIVLRFTTATYEKKLITALLASGFKEVPVDIWRLGDHYPKAFLPCARGTFSNITSQGAEGCISCPPGNLGLVQTSNQTLIVSGTNAYVHMRETKLINEDGIHQETE